MPVFIQGQHLHRDVACCGILFQMVEDRPAQHVGQEDVQRNGGGMELAGQRQSFRTAHSHQHLESLVVRQITQNTRVVRIVFNDQQDGIVGLQVCPIVRDALDRQLG